eukprot:1155982-Pelagomonas_calceolata.AAC.1
MLTSSRPDALSVRGARWEQGALSASHGYSTCFQGPSPQPAPSIRETRPSRGGQTHTVKTPGPRISTRLPSSRTTICVAICQGPQLKSPSISFYQGTQVVPVPGPPSQKAKSSTSAHAHARAALRSALSPSTPQAPHTCPLVEEPEEQVDLAPPTRAKAAGTCVKQEPAAAAAANEKEKPGAGLRGVKRPATGAAAEAR